MQNVRFFTSSPVVLVSFLLLVVGCEKSVERPDFDPKQSSKMALQLCDSNGDGLIDPDEMKAAPGLVVASEEIDSDGDKSISGDEIAQRFEYYRTCPSSVAGASFTVTYKKKPLSGATVTFEPESFMGKAFPNCSSVTDDYGQVVLSRPEIEEGGYPGIYLGMYRVKISKVDKGKEIIPAKYNESTMLGFESGSNSRSRTGPRFDLK